MRVLTAKEMAAFDRYLIEQVGLPGAVLMENASRSVADAIQERHPGAQRILVMVGPGNNGGDGLAVTRLLWSRGSSARALLAADPKSLSVDAAAQLDICRQLGVPHDDVSRDLEAARSAIAECDVVVDALFGTGLSRPLQGRWAELVEVINDCRAVKVAVDLPSGLDASRARPIGPFVHTQLSVTFAAPKVAHVLSPAAEAVGELVIGELGAGYCDVHDSDDDGTIRHHLLEPSQLAPALFSRPLEAHKGTCGHALIVAGSEGFAGAAILCASCRRSRRLRSGHAGGTGGAVGDGRCRECRIDDARLDP